MSLLIMPIQAISTSGGVSMKTEVSTSGDGQIVVESNVSSSQNSKTEVRVENSQTTVIEDGDAKDYKKVEVTVNGEKKVFESEEPIATPEVSIDFPKKEITIVQYIADEMRRVFEKLRSVFFGQ